MKKKCSNLLLAIELLCKMLGLELYKIIPFIRTSLHVTWFQIKFKTVKATEKEMY